MHWTLEILQILSQGAMCELKSAGESLRSFWGLSPASPWEESLQNVPRSQCEKAAGEPPQDSLRASGCVHDVSNTRQMQKWKTQKDDKYLNRDLWSRINMFWYNSACWTTPHLNPMENLLLLQMRLCRISPAVFCMCEKQTAVWTHFSSVPLQDLPENSLNITYRNEAATSNQISDQ